MYLRDMRMLLKSHKLIIILGVVLSFISFDGFATSNLPTQIQTELIHINSPIDDTFISYVNAHEIVLLKLIGIGATFNFDCFLKFTNHNQYTDFKYLESQFLIYKRSLDLDSWCTIIQLKSAHTQFHS